MKLLLAIAATGLLIGCSKPGNVPRNDWTSLHTAADVGDVAAIDRISKRQPALIDAGEAGDHTPLHVAAAGGQCAAAAHLLQQGASLEAQDVCGWTPLHIAAANNRLDIVKLLLAQGADVNAKDRHGQTPLPLALKYGHQDIARALRQQGGHASN